MKKIKRKTILLMSIILTFVLSACALPGLGGSVNSEGEPIIVAGIGSTEGLIINHIVAQMIEHYTGENVELLQYMGTSSMLHGAMLQDDANVASIKYTGTAITGELGMDPITDPDRALEVVVEEFANQFNQKWYPTYGFENSYAFMVTQETAEEYDLETVSDLEAHADELSAGVDSSWMAREGDGYQGFVEEYGFDFNEIFPMQIGLVYDAVANQEVDVVLGYSTDGRIQSYDLVVLEDDRMFFPPYDASPAVNMELLDSYPMIDDILYKLGGTISTEQMQQLNFIADDYLIEPANVAEEFLRENNYFEDKEPYIEPVQEGAGN